MSITLLSARFHFTCTLIIGVPIAAMLALVSKTAGANPLPDIATVDIYAHYDLSNPPTGRPYTGFVGQYYSPSLGFNFGDYTDLTSFVAVVTYSELLSTTGWYDDLIDSNNGVTANLWYKNYDFIGNGGGLFAYGEADNEFTLGAGIQHFQVDFFAGVDIPDGGPLILGGPPYTLGIAPPIPDFRFANMANATAVLLPIPDFCSTWELLGIAVIVLGALCRKFRPARELAYRFIE